MKKFLTILSFSFLCISAAAKGWYYQNLAAPDGTSRDFECVIAQPRGYVWGGMQHGLMRYGYNNDSRFYYADGQDGALPGDYIYNLEQDVYGRLWVFTDQGVARYNPASDSFDRLTVGGKPVVGYCSCQASNGLMYIGGEDELYIFDIDTDRVLNTVPLGIGGSFRVDAIYEPSVGSVLALLNKDSGFVMYYLNTGRIEVSNIALTDNYAYMMDSQKRFWRSQFNRGVECYENTSLVATYTTANSDLSSNVVTCFLENNGDIWIGTDGGGINILDPDTGVITHLKRTAGDYNSFPCSSVRRMCLDSSNAVWAVRSDGSALLLKEAYMRTIAFSPVNDQLGRSSDEVLSIERSRMHPNVVWVGTSSSGLYAYDFESPSLSPDIRKIDALGDRRVESMVLLPDGNLLVFCPQEGLFVYDPARRKLSPFTLIKDKDFYDSIKNYGQSVGLSLDNLGHVMILAKDAYIWDLSTSRIMRHPVTMHEGHEAIYPVSHGRGEYYFCEKYLYHWDATALKYEWICEFEDGNKINSVSMDSAGTFWFATENGVYFLPSGQTEAQRLNLDLISTAEVVMVDRLDRIWVATPSAMFVYLPKLDNLMRFSENDGVSWNRYNGKSILYTDEHLLFGGVNGLLSVDPSVDFYLSDNPELTIQDVYLNSNRLSVVPSRLTLTSAYKSLEIHLFVHENNILRDKQFRFIIKNRHGDTVIDKDEPFLSFALLPPGIHKVTACCTLQNGAWTDPVEILELKVLPLWYKSWWFWLIVFIVVILFVILIIRSFRTDADYKLALAASEAENKAGQDSLKFLLNVSHELKTPLTLIISPLSRLLKNKDKTDPEYITLNNVLRQANRMSSLILTVLDSHKFQDGSASFNGEVTKLNDWVYSHAADFEEEALSRQINLIKKFDPAVGDAMVDSQKLENVITNMMINALKHSPDNTTLSVGTIFLEDKNQYRVFVSDEGEGLGGVDMTKLFSRFYQGFAQKSGSGLGLAYANSIVELHGGMMGAYENQGRGATFYFDLPTAEAYRQNAGSTGQEDKTHAPSSRASHFERLAKKMEAREGDAGAPAAELAKAEEEAETKSIADATILIVDDDADLREYLIEELSAVAAVVLSAPNGKKAYDLLQNKKVDIVVSDVMMPVMDGFELTEKIKKNPSYCNIPVILLTARAEPKSREQGLALGADSYLPKPFDKDALIKTIDEMLAH